MSISSKRYILAESRSSRFISGVAEDYSWQPTPEPRRKCDLCITLIRRTNPESLCSCCLRKVEEAQAAKERGEHLQMRQIAAAYARQKRWE